MEKYKEYEYHGYILKQVPKRIGYGLTWAIYKDGELIGYGDNNEKRARETADFHARYGGGYGVRG